ncbi:MAG: hypothetical protein KAS16_08755 [Thermoplasmata archaeon]|nr:hypothetical protein [Thermoplasmata archaeon]
MNVEKVKKSAWGITKDVLLALIVVVIVMGALFAYCQVWPPVVVVESGSMMHGMNSEIGIIDTGDMVLVKKAPSKEDVMTFIEGESRNKGTYGEFGDVIIYRPNGRDDLTPIIHRAVLWMNINTTHVQTLPDEKIDYNNYTYDIPELGLYDTTYDFTLSDYGYKSRDVSISPNGIIYNFRRMNVEPHSGYITMGDNNCPTYDQRQGSYLLVKEEWVVGKAFGELPWFGLIKLSLTGDLETGAAPPNSWQNLSIAILLLLGIPLFIDFGLPLFLKKDDDEKNEGAGSDENASDPDEDVDAEQETPSRPEDLSSDPESDKQAERTEKPPENDGGVEGEKAEPEPKNIIEPVQNDEPQASIEKPVEEEPGTIPEREIKE